jgi:hypothetical protein
VRNNRLAVSIAAASLVFGIAGCSSKGNVASSPSASTHSAAYQQAYTLGLEAYTYGLPLLTTNATFQTMTSVNVSSGTYGPVNQFNNVRSSNTSGSTAVVAPGATSLSSIAWLDLKSQPQVLHVPKVTDHFFVLALIDPYTENVVNFGTATSTTPGDYVISGPGQSSTPIPAGTHRVSVPYNRIWVIGSTQLKGPNDVAAVNAIQDQYTITPLSAYGTHYTPPAPTTPVTTVTKYAIPTGLAFFDSLGEQLALFPPPAADANELSALAAVGIGPGRTPSTDTSLSTDTRQGLVDAVSAGQKQIGQDTKTLYASSASAHAGYLLGGFGTYGTNYTERAVISQVGLGAFVAHQAIYAMAWSDKTGAALNGSTSYVLHLAAPPPTTEGWSLTVYSLKGALVANSLGRYAFTNISTLARNADGSIDFYLQAQAPSDAAHMTNWLPTPAGQGFEVTWRLFAPQPSAINGIVSGAGWQPPAIAAS